MTLDFATARLQRFLLRAPLLVVILIWLNCPVHLKIGHAAEPASAVVIYRVRSEVGAEPFSAKLKNETINPRPSDLIAAERFFAAPLTDNKLLTLYDCIHPLDEFRYFFISGQKIAEAKLWAADPWMNLAVLQCEVRLPAFQIGAPNKAQELHLSPSSMMGELGVSGELRVVSDRLRTSETFKGLQTTLHNYGQLLGLRSNPPLLPGAPLLDKSGQLRSIALGTLSESTSQDSLCIALDDAAVLAIEAILTGEPQSYGFLGLEPGNLSDLPTAQGRKGVYVRQVMRHSPAERAALREENPRTGEVDLISAMDGELIESTQELLAKIGRQPFGANISLTIHRGMLGGEKKIFEAKCVLGKRFVSQDRPPYSQQPPTMWRGMKVDHYTAIDEYAARARLVDPKGCVVIVSVDSNSSAWKAGLRPGMFLTKIGEVRVADVAAFTKATGHVNGTVKVMTTARADGVQLEPQTFEIAP